MRTRFADDLLWLPLPDRVLRAARPATGACSTRPRRFLDAPRARAGRGRGVPRAARLAASRADVYEHCCRAIDRSLVRGAHGLPLFGTGDWNDGMNRVGREGRGESVWMGFFLHAILGDFVPLCERRGDHARAERYARFRDQLRVALNDAGWDGEWYRRAYYDNGAPLGSTAERRVPDRRARAGVGGDLSGAAPPERARRRMDAVERELVSERDGLIRLLTPPFEDTPQRPGLHQGLRAGRARERRAVHARRAVGRARVRASSAATISPRACSPC